jgi:shikimate 5-dehydrogenase
VRQLAALPQWKVMDGRELVTEQAYVHFELMMGKRVSRKFVMKTVLDAVDEMSKTNGQSASENRMESDTSL